MESCPTINILLVDDRPENLLALEAILDSPSYRLVKARSGDEALRSLLKHPFSLILLDVQMPGLNGFETAKLIKSREMLRHIPIVFMSAIHKAYEYVFQGYSVGAVDYLFTPYDPEIVRAKVASLVDLFNRGNQQKPQADLLYQNERRRRYRRLSEAMPIIVWTAAPDGSIDHINKQWRNYTGLTFEQSKGWRWMTAVHPDDLQGCLMHLTQTVRLGRESDIECRLKKKNGSYRRHRIRAVPERNLKGEIVGWFGSAVDIHDQTRRQETDEETMERSY